MLHSIFVHNFVNAPDLSLGVAPGYHLGMTQDGSLDPNQAAGQPLSAAPSTTKYIASIQSSGSIFCRAPSLRYLQYMEIVHIVVTGLF